MRTAPENITELSDDEVFVFGSNLLGIHGLGAAKTARELFGAELGVGEGMTGRCYAFPTLGSPYGSGNEYKFSVRKLEQARDRFYTTVNEHPELVFLLTKVGCGLAGYLEEDMISLFSGSPQNVVKPAGW